MFVSLLPHLDPSAHPIYTKTVPTGEHLAQIPALGQEVRDLIRLQRRIGMDRHQEVWGGCPGQYRQVPGGEMVLHFRSVGMAALGHKNLTAVEEFPKSCPGSRIAGESYGTLGGIDTIGQGSPGMSRTEGRESPLAQCGSSAAARRQLLDHDRKSWVQDKGAVGSGERLQVGAETHRAQDLQGPMESPVGSMLQGKEEWGQVSNMVGVEVGQEDMGYPVPG
jgi:hypothetical protein